MPKTCFVISPIGDEASAVRKAADDFLELIVEPSLEGRGFEIIRADRIVSSGVITNEIVELVQSADLCIVDLTDHNANVFYECGRRHEAARPFIQMIRKGEKLPFDVAGIRTLMYDLTDPRAIRNTITDVRKLVDALTRTSHSVSRSAVSLTTVAEAIDRLERKLDEFRATPKTMTPVQSSSIRSRKYPPTQQFLMAASRNDWAEAASVLAELHASKGLTRDVMIGAARVASEGEEIGKNILFEALDDLKIDADERDVSLPEALQALIFYFKAEAPAEGLARLRERVEKVLSDEAVAVSLRASLANGIQMLSYAIRDYDTSVEFGETAYALDPSDLIFRKNLSMSYEKTKQLGKAKELIDGALEDPRGQQLATVLDQGIDVYSALGESETVEKLLATLREVDPDLAHFRAYLLSRGEEEDDE